MKLRRDERTRARARIRFYGVHVTFPRFSLTSRTFSHGRLLIGRVDNRVTHQIVTIDPYCPLRGQTMVY